MNRKYKINFKLFVLLKFTIRFREAVIPYISVSTIFGHNSIIASVNKPRTTWQFPAHTEIDAH